MKRKELISLFVKFFVSKNHKRIKNSSLVPENDPTVLFTTAGVHPLIPYLLGEKHPYGKRLVNVQRCIRTGDIEKVGDETHHTFFEMLGNWSLGDYWKEEAIKYSAEFLMKTLKIPKEKIGISVFSGSTFAPKDKETEKIWKSVGIKDERIVFLDDNWWGPAGETGPCGPDTEMFIWVGKEVPKDFNPRDKRWVEIWNDVFMEYYKDKEGNYNKAEQKNVDTGMGVERMIAVLNNLNDNYLSDAWWPIIEKLEVISGEKYGLDEEKTRVMRIIADHIKASVFIINDGVTPSNTERGYVLRRLIRRAIRYGKILGIEKFTSKLAEPVFSIYDEYEFNKSVVISELEKEEEKFSKTIEKGLRVFDKLASNVREIDGKNAFLLYQSYGFPIEMTKELCKERKIKIDEEGFNLQLQKHRALSQTASKGKFKSGLADHSLKTTKLHTATHLLNEALVRVLGTDVKQKGSNINSERTRFDFSFDRKLTDEEIKKVEDMVNDAIKKDLKVSWKEMKIEEARKYGARGVFDEKYGEIVKVYSIGDFSKEICSGPHVERTGVIGKFKIIKQSSVGSGVRRIKAVLE